jgi:ribosome-binding protein aMBF1 (putative translation factor)
MGQQNWVGIGERVHAARVAAGMSQSDLAAAVELTLNAS